MPFGLGIGELLIILAVLLLVFGAKRLPELGGALGKGIREFKTSVRDIEGELKRPADQQQRELQRPVNSTTPPPAAPPVSEARNDTTTGRDEPRQS